MSRPGLAKKGPADFCRVAHAGIGAWRYGRLDKPRNGAARAPRPPAACASWAACAAPHLFCQGLMSEPDVML